MLPALRLGFLIAPASLQAALRAAKRLTDWHGELPTQAALARFIEEGLLARHIRKAAREYAVRRGRIVDALQYEFGRWLQLVPSAAGLHVTARVIRGAKVDIDNVIARAQASGVAVYSLARFCGEFPLESGLVIGYGAIQTAKVEEGLRRLVASFRG